MLKFATGDRKLAREGVPLSMHRINVEPLHPDSSQRSAAADFLFKAEPDDEEEEEEEDEEEEDEEEEDDGAGDDAGDEGYSE
jgi:hypothetical protein